ncbi:MAG: glycosyltransferase family 4 protein, partial [Limisphaerales bacterium]
LGGGPNPDAVAPYVRVPNLRRDFPVLRRLVPWSKRYLAEQLTFLRGLRRRLLAGPWRLVHLCDPDLALQMHWRRGGSGFRVVFKDGMCLGPQWCSRLDFVQVLAPHYRDVVAREAGVDTSGWFVIPHLVDVGRFRPPADRRAARRAWPELGLPQDAFVVLGVGDYSVDGNKRLDWLVREVASLPQSAGAYLVLAGQSDPSRMGRFEAQARGLLGERVRLLRNLPRPQVLRLYEVADVFAHAALREPFGIVFLEAMACGLPLVGHTWPVTQWVIGDAGETLDMTKPGALSEVLARWAREPEERNAVAGRARRRAEEFFAPDRLVPRYLAMYETILAAGSGATGVTRE